MVPTTRKVECILAVVLFARMSCAHGVLAQEQPELQQLFRQFQSEQTTKNAEIRLLQLAKDDPKARRFIAPRLPAMIAVDPRGTTDYYEKHQSLSTTWCNAVDLAGKLKIAEAAPALAKWVALSTNPGLNFGAGEISHHPAAVALVQIGDAAIPDLTSALNTGDKDLRSSAADTLLELHSTKADAVLWKYSSDGHDRELARYIERTLEIVDRNYPAP